MSVKFIFIKDILIFYVLKSVNIIKEKEKVDRKM